MKVNANDLRVGNVIDHKGKLWVMTKIAHTQPGKGGAYIQAEMKAVLDGTKLNDLMRSGESVERVILEDIPYQYLFEEDGMLTFMHPESFEQITLPDDILGDAAVYLQDGMMVDIQFHDGKALSANLPKTVVLEVAETEPVVKGQTAASSNKPAIMENGVRIMVPPFINVGDKLVINTHDNAYVERDKS